MSVFSNIAKEKIIYQGEYFFLINDGYAVSPGHILIISNEEKLDYFHSIHKIPNIIFHGPSGSGKRTIVYKFIEDIYKNDKELIKKYVMNVNCAHGKGIKFVREELKFFAKTHVFQN